MGTQQIMLVILSVVLIGISVLFAVIIFGNHAANTNRQLVVNELDFLASQAIRYWRTPVGMGGASNDIDESDQANLEFFLRWSGDSNSTESGTYSILANADGTIKITGIGTEIGRDRENPIEVLIHINPGTREPFQVTFVN